MTGARSERIRRVEAADSTQPCHPTDVGSDWWSRYQESLDEGSLTPASKQVLDLDSQYIVDCGIFGAGNIPDEEGRWPPSRLRRGLVMGSVQSGKTASLIAVTAKALDRGVDIVVVLAGTRIALWRQTYDRVLKQLDRWDDANDLARRTQRILLPTPSSILGSETLPRLEDLYFSTPNLVKRRLTERKPMVAVVMKQSDHLMYFSKYLHSVFDSALATLDRPIHVLVIDDEADDGSILDSEVEGGLAPDSELLKQIPRHIARIWSGHHPAHETLHPLLYATYVAYTATPQSNFLQSDHNPLSPGDFIAALRVPLNEGTIVGQRSTTFDEPVGLPRYYTGGELFYRRMANCDGQLCLTRPFPRRTDVASADDFEVAVADLRSELLSDALRSYFISGAIKLLLSRRTLSGARSASSDTEQGIRAITPDPHTMLFHPAARIDTHFDAARVVAHWSAEILGDVDEGLQEEVPQLNVAGLIARLNGEEELWRAWLAHFNCTSERLSFFRGGGSTLRDLDSRWPEIRTTLIEEVFPFTRIAVINSDPRADDRPRFEPERLADGRFVAPSDLFTIFVSGNVMARGITLEGLTTTLFLRASNEPLADTQMQMQRWFGYRGAYLRLCRAFMFDDQLDLFRSYHENDEALRSEIIHEMNENPGKAPLPLVLQGRRYCATGKIANLHALPLCPGADPFIRVLEFGAHASHNAQVLTDLLETDEWNSVVVGGRSRGVAMRKQLSLLEVAHLLESFRYGEHDPNLKSEIHDRWRALASQIGLTAPEAPLFRPPHLNPKAPNLVSPPQCPYSVAAYLRLWSSLLSRRARSFFPTDNAEVPWSMLNLVEYARTAPNFIVGLRYGSAGLSSHPALSAKGVLRMDRDHHGNVLRSTWGSRNPGDGDDAYFGDQLFDYHVHHQTPPRRVTGEPAWRKRGSPGLVLFHVIRGEEADPDAIGIGLAIPAGGPDHISALRSH